MNFDQKIVSDFLNKHIIVGLTYLDHKGNFVKQVQFHGDILRINESEGIVIKINNSNKEYVLPPDLSAIKKAPPGEYRFKSTGEVVVNPDLMTSWTINKPDPNESKL